MTIFTRDSRRFHLAETSSAEQKPGLLPKVTRPATLTTRDLSWFEGRKSLDWFFDRWVNDIDVPSLDLEDVKFARKGGTTVVTGKLVQKNAPRDLVTCVPIYASVPGRPLMFVARVFADGEETSFRLTVSPAARKLLLDPEHTLLTRP